jgi:fumarate hydratase subunit alpha
MARTVSTKIIGEEVARMCHEANFVLPPDVMAALQEAKIQTCGLAAAALDVALMNASVAVNEHLPLCQDTGIVVIFLEVGQNVMWTGDYIIDVINAAVGKVYTESFFRASVVKNPLSRENTGNNAPAVIHYEVVPGDEVKISVIPKGFGSENKTMLRMLNPAAGRGGLVEFVLETVRKAGADPCPPIVVGVGMGGTSEKCALLAKKALLRKIGQYNPDTAIASLEKELLREVNKLGIGPQGTGGSPTALWAAIESFPTHIAGFPVCVCLNCHVARHIEVTI